VGNLEHELLAGEEAVGHDLARAERHSGQHLRVRHAWCCLPACGAREDRLRRSWLAGALGGGGGGEAGTEVLGCVYIYLLLMKP